MPRNLVICCDGTSNEFGRKNTNVVRLVQLLDPNATTQLVYYDPGVGTLPGAGLRTRLGKTISQMADLAVAVGLEGKIERAYRYLMNTWQPGDNVYVFGFSRGAYTARVLCGMLNAVGLLHAQSDNLFPYALRLFVGIRSERRKTGNRTTYQTLADEFRETFAQTIPGRTDRRFTVHFVGLWDTVSSVGLPWDPVSFPFTALNPALTHVRHAVALDERRAFFRQNLVHAAAGQDVRERWFAGYHCDVGGGYSRQESGICAAALGWIADEAADVGLALSPAARDAVAPDGTPWQQTLHESLRGLWNLAEVFPKPTFDPSTKQRRIRFNFWSPRPVQTGSWLHQSLAERLYHDHKYNPGNLSAEFVNALRSGPAPSGDVLYS